MGFLIKRTDSQPSAREQARADRDAIRRIRKDEEARRRAEYRDVRKFARRHR